jgi:hypothetical protein
LLASEVLVLFSSLLFLACNSREVIAGKRGACSFLLSSFLSGNGDEELSTQAQQREMAHVIFKLN